MNIWGKLISIVNPSCRICQEPLARGQVVTCSARCQSVHEDLRVWGWGPYDGGVKGLLKFAGYGLLTAVLLGVWFVVEMGTPVDF